MTEYKDKILELLLGITLGLFISLILRFSLHPHGEGCPDAYYHVAIAEMGSEYYAGKIFPHMTMSVWAEHFYDKELGFHFLIENLRKILSLFGLAGGPPFLIENAFFLFLLFSAFAICLAVFSIEFKSLYFLALVSISPYFIQRLILLRPHLLGIAIMLCAFAAFSFVKTFKTIFVPLFFGFIFAYSYSQPHFVLLPATAYAVVSILRDKDWKALLIPLLAIIGVIAGLTFHPQFPNTFILWKIQCIDVPLKMLGNNIPVILGNEMQKPQPIFYLQNIAILILFVINMVVLATNIKINGWKYYDRHTYAASIVASVSIFGLLFSYRPMEYACPFTLLLTGMLLKKAPPFLLENCEFRKPQFIIKPAIYVFMFFSSIFALAFTINYKGYDYLPLESFRNWAQEKKIPTGTKIANVNWSDFPQLFYSVPQFRFLFGIDPMFGYCYSPEKVEKFESFRTGMLKLSPEKLYEIVEARFVFISLRGAPLAKDMFKNGFYLVYQGDDGWLFDLTPTITIP